MFSQTFRRRLPTSQAWRLGFREDEGEHVSRTASHTGESKRLCSGRTERRAEAGRRRPKCWAYLGACGTQEAGRGPGGVRSPPNSRCGWAAGARAAPESPAAAPGCGGGSAGPGPEAGGVGLTRGRAPRGGPSRLRPPAAPPGAAASLGARTPGRAAGRASRRLQGPWRPGPGRGQPEGCGVRAGAPFYATRSFKSLLSALLTCDGQQSHLFKACSTTASYKCAL